MKKQFCRAEDLKNGLDFKSCRSLVTSGSGGGDLGDFSTSCSLAGRQWADPGKVAGGGGTQEARAGGVK